MRARKHIEGLRKQVRAISQDDTVAAISRLMDELSAAAVGGHHPTSDDLEVLFAEAKQQELPRLPQPDKGDS
jgi:hypothetical protein